jgi:hypothetical protein
VNLVVHSKDGERKKEKEIDKENRKMILFSENQRKMKSD